MKKNLLFAGLIYAVVAVALMIYLSVVASENEEAIGVFYVAGSTFLFFGLSFLSYLVYFIKQLKVVEESAYIEYLGMGIRVQLGLLVSAVAGILFCLTLVYCRSQDYIGHIWEIAIPIVVLVGVNMTCFLSLKPRP